ncbi:G-type lectin S-receptor-like serine/threonine-protein kinase At4g03230 [Corylus avellana]|uniref:G-type lectin S-receptor-like serine/threonine-protein kinase At4g03230 n=1 Tax=Corylus avellana TaxID=13451 RepID=UPI00286D0C49|nr:G-type lectin S-receptor-like serine/threonine-protein kinase At4g03230 [Corylus avellana]
MSYTGELQYYRSSGVDQLGNWSLIWRKPEDKYCSIYNFCGNFGSCNINNRPLVCKCLPGFHPNFPKDWDNSRDFSGGCTRNSRLFDERDMFLSLNMMKVSNEDYYVAVPNDTTCRRLCLNNNQCQAYSSPHPVCIIWTSDLSDLQEEYIGGFNLSIRVAKSDIDTLKKGEWITDDGNQTTLVSSGGTFELGFFTPINSSSHSRYFEIWYHKWDQQTVVWVANRGDPILNGSTGTFGIAEDGNLKVLDTTGKQDYWSVVFDSSSTNRTVKLMDSGNLVFSDEDNQSATSLWESFQNPTDTVLPGMNISEFLSLTSWKSDGDPGFGQFMFNRNLEVIGGGAFRGYVYVISKDRDTGVDYWRILSELGCGPAGKLVFDLEKAGRQIL